MGKRLIRSIFEKEFLPILILLLAVVTYFTFYQKIGFTLLEETIEEINKWVFVVFAAIIALLVHRLSSALLEWYGENVAERTSISLDDEFLPLLRKLAIFLIWAIVVLITLSRFGINTNGLIAALGVGSLAIALAAQDTISNIISGFLIMVDGPYRINDTIKLPSGEKVKVLDIGLRRSKFEAEDGAIIIVPNLALSKSKIINYTYGKENTKSQSS